MTLTESFAVRDQRQPGWFFVDNELVDKYGARLGAYGLAIYAVLSRHCKNSTQQVNNLSQRDIGGTLGISQDRVRKSLLDLVEFQLIHVDVPEHPSPGIISTITLLSVKTTERHTFSSTAQLNATRSGNKEDKTETKTKPKHPPTPLFEGVADNFSQQHLTSRDRRLFFEELNRIYAASQGAVVQEEDAIRIACVNTGTPLESAREWVALSYGEKAG